MLKLLNKRYYPFEDYAKNCKHKLENQTSLSCRKRRDGTFIGDSVCKWHCRHNIGFGGNNRKWIKCKYLKEAIGE